jgi:beta-glucanase (GH16 family)
MKIKTCKPTYLACLVATLPLVMAGCTSSGSSAQRVDLSTQFNADNNVVEAKDGWTLVWNDEFNGDSIDTTKWKHEVNCWGGGNKEQQCYVDSKRNSYVSNGFLTIRAIKQRTTGPATPEDWGNYGQQTSSLPYSSARLRTKDLAEWTYGRFDIRAKLPQGQGTWPAIWMLPTDYVYGGWAASGEIDIMEAVNLHTTYTDDEQKTRKENRIHGTLHFGKNWPNNVSSGVGYDFGNENINPADDFHTYSIEWEQGEIRWYVDDIHYATQTQDGWWTHYQNEDKAWVSGPSDAPFNQRFHLLLNLAIGGSWAGETNHKGIDPTLDHADMLIDYVRVYQCSADINTGKGCASKISQSAEHTSGVDEPPLTFKKIDLNAATLPIMEGTTLNDSFHLNGWDDSNNDVRAVTKEGFDIQIIGAGNAYTEALGGPIDMSNFKQGELSFDLMIDAIDADGLTVKMDSGWPNVAPIHLTKQALPANKQWKTIRIKVSDFVNASATFNLASVVNPVVFEPLNGKNIHFKVKNIHFSK